MTHSFALYKYKGDSLYEECISYCKTQMDEDDKCPVCQFSDSILLALGCPSHLLVGTMHQDRFKGH